MSTQYLYSVVIPHYNSPKALERMLRSIPERDDIQVIVVDDGSERSSVLSLQKLRHKNLTVLFSDENKGGGYQRNVGLDHAEGKWLLCADADDRFAVGAFDVFDKFSDTDIDYLLYRIVCLDPSTLTPIKNYTPSDDSVRLYLENPSKHNYQLLKFRNTDIWNKMVSLEFIKQNHIRWEGNRINIDVMYTFQLSLHAKRICVIDDVLYEFIGEESSITKKKRTIEREFQFFLAAQKRNGFFKQLGMNYPFYRPTWLYLPFMLKKRGVKDTLTFFKMILSHRSEIKEARSTFLPILLGIDKKDVDKIPIVLNRDDVIVSEQ